MTLKDWNTYYRCIGGTDVEVGTLLGHASSFARITGFTKTQARCIALDSDLSPKTEKGHKFNITLDKGASGGGVKVGSRGSYRWAHYEVITEQEAHRRLASAQEEAEYKRAKQAKRAAEYNAAVKARKERMRDGYENRLLLSGELGLWSMQYTNRHGQPVLITWRSEAREDPDWSAKWSGEGEYPTKTVYHLHLAFWYRDFWDGEVRDINGPASTTADGPDELTALASRGYN